MASLPIFPLQPPSQEAMDPELLRAIQQATQQHAADQAAMQEALQGLQTAEAEPTQQVNPLSAALGNTLARLGTTIAGPQGPNYAAQQQSLLQQKNKGFEESRTENIKRLRATYEAAAKRAAESGDHESEIKARAAIHKLDVQAKKDAEEARQKFEKDQQARLFGHQTELQNSRLAAEAARAAAKKTEDEGTTKADIEKTAVINTGFINPATNKEYQIVDTTLASDKDSRNAARKIAAEKGIRAASKDDVQHLHDINTTTTSLEQSLDQLMESRLPKDAMERVVQAPGIKMSAFLQSNPARAAYKTWRTEAIQAIKAVAGGAGSGLRMNEVEIKFMADALPKITDTYTVAQKKMEIINRMLMTRALPYLDNDWSKTKSFVTRQLRDDLKKLDEESAAAPTTVKKFGAKPATTKWVIQNGKLVQQ